MKFKKRGDEIKKKSSPLKLLSQFQPNFAGIVPVIKFEISLREKNTTLF
jgi:hypothetical protein